MSGFEILTITFSFIVGLGMAQVLRSVGHVIRERDRISLHWIPFSAAVLILFFQIQFWFGLAVINSLLEQWAWPVYSLVLSLAVLIFLAGATVLPPPGTPVDQRNLLDEVKHGGDTQLPDLLGPVPTGGTFSPLSKGRVYGLELTYNF